MVLSNLRLVHLSGSVPQLLALHLLSTILAKDLPVGLSLPVGRRQPVWIYPHGLLLNLPVLVFLGTGFQGLAVLLGVGVLLWVLVVLLQSVRLQSSHRGVLISILLHNEASIFNIINDIQASIIFLVKIEICL